MSWQPIETAPHDGTEVLVGRGGKYPRVSVSIWDEPTRRWLNFAEQPTHWMPKPDPPAAAAVSLGERQ